jgi:thioredoxin reductase (NADPH)
MEAQLCENQGVIVIGGGNSAGQAAIYLSNTAAHVHMMVRAAGLAATMSHYLIERIEASPRITLHTHTELSALYGERILKRVRWVDRQSGAETEADIGAIFVMIGAEPNTGWLQGCAELDGKGFVKTGSARSPYETTRAGLFAVGDVRSGSVKRVASGVGEGSVVVQAIHAALADADVAQMR